MEIYKKPTVKQATVGITQTTSHKEHQNMNFDIYNYNQNFYNCKKFLNYFPVEPKPLSPRVTTPLIS